jgi:urease gamma subunit
MADVKPIPSSGFNLLSINGVINTINAAFSIPDTPVAPLPPPLIMFGAKLRPGLSAQSIAANIISKQSESGRVVGDVFADGPNVEEAMEVIRVQEIVNALLNEAKVEVVIPPGVSVLTVGVGNLGAPVISQGSTTSMGIGDGVIR